MLKPLLTEDSEVSVQFKSSKLKYKHADCMTQTDFAAFSLYVSSQLNHVPVSYLIISK